MLVTLITYYSYLPSSCMPGRHLNLTCSCLASDQAERQGPWVSCWYFVTRDIPFCLARLIGQRQPSSQVLCNCFDPWRWNTVTKLFPSWKHILWRLRKEYVSNRSCYQFLAISILPAYVQIRYMVLHMAHSDDKAVALVKHCQYMYVMTTDQLPRKARTCIPNDKHCHHKVWPK